VVVSRQQSSQVTEAIANRISLSESCQVRSEG